MTVIVIWFIFIISAALLEPIYLHTAFRTAWNSYRVCSFCIYYGYIGCDCIFESGIICYRVFVFGFLHPTFMREVTHSDMRDPVALALSLQVSSFGHLQMAF
jgi:hypothetical protein